MRLAVVVCVMLAAARTVDAGVIIDLGTAGCTGVVCGPLVYPSGLLTLTATGGTFTSKTRNGATGLGISGKTQGEIDVNEFVRGSFSSPVTLEALTILERLGATAAANALRRRMREQGMRRIPRGSRTSTRTNTHGLTKREAEIFELLAQGLRNSVIAKRLFVTTKTVDHHVSAIFTKLGVSSRAEAIALASKKPAESG